MCAEKTIMHQDQSVINQQFASLAKAERLLPIKVPAFFRKKVEAEVSALGHIGGPLHRSVYPTLEKLELHAPGEVNDFVEDRSNMPDSLKNCAIRKYSNRLLFFPTNVCAGHCLYCFRQDVLSELHDSSGGGRALKNQTDSLLDYLESDPTITEVILSGGDPLTLPLSHLQELLQRLVCKFPQLNLRIHSRVPIFNPSMIKQSHIDVMASSRVRLVIHTIHPYELCTEVEEKICEMKAKGVRLYAQFPILRGINDHVKVLARHLELLDIHGIRTLSMFIPDPIRYSATFRLRLSRLFSILDELNWHTSAWINSTRVVLDTPFGKVRREDISKVDEATDIVHFQRNGKDIAYPDFPEKLDLPGKIETLLWKDKLF